MRLSISQRSSLLIKMFLSPKYFRFVCEEFFLKEEKEEQTPSFFFVIFVIIQIIVTLILSLVLYLEKECFSEQSFSCLTNIPMISLPEFSPTKIGSLRNDEGYVYDSGTNNNIIG